MFINAFLRQRERLEADARRFLDASLSLLCPDDADGQVKRVARRFLLCAAAGEMAVQLGLLPWARGAALTATETCFKAWLAQRGGCGAAEDTAILEQVMLFLEQHGASRFQDIAQRDAVCRDRVGFRATENGRTTYYILPHTIKAEVCKGFPPARAAALLRDKGLLLAGDSGSFTRKPAFELPGLGRKRCYTLVV
jgi:putative DNA primase/helicase